ncbi:MAG: MFS transporter [Deltaproteobacteria bacterium]|nr:MFS transporter [Deltaproteobacteria bacterium]
MSTGKKLGLLATLYLSQGLPYGFFVTAVPVLLRKQGSSLALVSLSSVLLLPWGCKLLVAPFVDKHHGSPLGARRGWILPLQVMTALCVLAAALAGEAVGRGGELLMAALAIATVLTAVLAATQDCATDGLAVELLEHRERGLGNGVQVAAYRLGMIVGGSALLVVFDVAGWLPTFVAMAALLLVATVPIALWREPAGTPPPTAAALAIFRRFLARPRVWPWLALIVLYKVGDAFGSPMVKPLLVDRGLSLADIGVLVGGFGSAAALIGALAGGWLAGRAGRGPALLGAGLVHALLMGAYALPVYGYGGTALLSTLMVLEHLTGSMATVALFTVMMDASDESTGATDYTVQASVIVWATFAGAAPSGLVAQSLGYAAHFLIAGLVCALGAIVLPWGLTRGALPPRAP